MSDQDVKPHKYKITGAERWPSNFQTLVNLFKAECAEAHNSLDYLSNNLINKNFDKISPGGLIGEMRKLNDAVFLLMEFNQSVEQLVSEKEKNNKFDLCSESESESLHSCFTELSSKAPVTFNKDRLPLKQKCFKSTSTESSFYLDNNCNSANQIETRKGNKTPDEVAEEILKPSVKLEMAAGEELTMNDVSLSDQIQQLTENYFGIRCKPIDVLLEDIDSTSTGYYVTDSKVESSSNLESSEEVSSNYEIAVEINIPPQAPLEVKKKLKCFVTHVESPSNFYIVLLSKDGEDSRMLTALNEYYNEGFQYTTRCELEKYLYYACLHENKWSRVQLIDPLQPDEDLVEVYFMDVGLTSRVPFFNLTPLKEQFCSLPPLAYHCHLIKAKPLSIHNGKWTNKAIKFMKNKVLRFSGVLTVEEIACDSYGVLLSISGNQINLALIMKNLASDPTEEVTVPAVVPKTPDKAEIHRIHVSLPPCLTLPIKKSLKCFVSHVETPHKFFVNILEDEAPNSMEEKMKLYYHDFEHKFSDSSECTQLYFACIHENTWSRVMITGNINPPRDDLEVFFLDKGLQTDVPVANLRPLSPQFCSEPPAAVLCHLFRVAPNGRGWSNKAIKAMKNYVSQKNGMITVEERFDETHAVMLNVGSVNINLELIIKNFAKEVVDTHSIVLSTKVLPVDSTSTNQEKSTQDVPMVVNPSTTALTESPTAPELPEVYKLSATSSPIDAAKTEGAPTASSVIMPSSSLNHTTSQSGRIITQPPADDVDNYILDQPMGLEEEDVGIGRAVQGFSANDEADVCKHYKGPPATTCFKGSRCKKKHIMLDWHGWTVKKVPALMNTFLEMRLPPPDTLISIAMTIVDSYCSFYGHILESEDKMHIGSLSEDPHAFPKELQHLSQKMNSPAALKALKTFDTMESLPGIGELVAAFYSKDGLWYRARVLGPGAFDVEVLYVDFGNREVLTYDQVGVLQRVFAELPIQAVRFVLGNIKLEPSAPEEDRAAAKRTLFDLSVDRRLYALVLSIEADDLHVILYDTNADDIGILMCNMGLVASKEYEVMKPGDRVLTEDALRLHNTVRRTNQKQDAILYGTQYNGIFPG